MAFATSPLMALGGPMGMPQMMPVGFSGLPTMGASPAAGFTGFENFQMSPEMQEEMDPMQGQAQLGGLMSMIELMMAEVLMLGAAQGGMGGGLQGLMGGGPGGVGAAGQHGGNAHHGAHAGKAHQSNGGTEAPASNGPIKNPTDFAKALLGELGAPVTKANVDSLVNWEKMEGGHWNNTAHFNPLNTTQRESGSSSMNSVGVQAYKSWDQGLQATIETLRNGNYGDIIAALKSGKGLSHGSLKGLSTWSGGGYSSI